MKILRAEVQTFVHATEELEKVLSCLREILPKFTYEVERTEGHFGNPIDIVRITFQGKKATELLLGLIERLSSEEKKQLAFQIEDRLQNGNFYLRLDKMKACSGIVSIGEGIQLTFTLTSYPFNRKKIIEELRQAFS